MLLRMTEEKGPTMSSPGKPIAITLHPPSAHRPPPHPFTHVKINKAHRLAVSTPVHLPTPCLVSGAFGNK